MNIEQASEIAAAAFKAHSPGIDVVRVNIRRGFGREGDLVVDVYVICKGEGLRGRRFLGVDGRIVGKVWGDGEGCAGWPLVRFIPKPEIGRRGAGGGVLRPGAVQPMAERQTAS